MEKLNYRIDINAPKDLVWANIVDPDKYKVWTRAFSPNSSFTGEWKKGSEIQFFDPELGGSVAIIEDIKPAEFVVAKHIATMTKDKVIETKGPITEKWMGTLETYKLSESKGVTYFDVEMQVHPDFINMFVFRWPQALMDLKSLVEGSAQK